VAGVQVHVRLVTVFPGTGSMGRAAKEAKKGEEGQAEREPAKEAKKEEEGQAEISGKGRKREGMIL